MKTKDVIKLLQQADPTGEVEVCVGNVDIHCIYQEEAYYDGALQVLIRDDNKQGYNITGGKYVRKGNKVQIIPLSITDIVWNEDDGPEVTIDYSELSEYQAERAKKIHESIRKKNKEIINEVNLEIFQDWVKKKALILSPAELEDVDGLAKDFFLNNDVNCKVGKVPLGKSVKDIMEEQWDKNYELFLADGYNLKIKKITPVESNP
jgi:hypothetical protein